MSLFRSSAAEDNLMYKSGDELIVLPRPMVRPFATVSTPARQEYHARETVAPSLLAIVGTVVLFIFAMAVLVSCLQFAEQSTQIDHLTTQISELSKQNTELLAEYNDIYSDDVVAAAAAEYGMVKQSADTVYVDLSLPDSATVYTQESTLEQLVSTAKDDISLLTGFLK